MSKNGKRNTNTAVDAGALAIAVILVPFTLASDGALRAVFIVAQIVLIATIGARYVRAKRSGTN